MRLLAGCSSGGCPSVWVADDGGIVVQGEFVGFLPQDYRGDPSVTYSSNGPREARVRIPADVLRRAVEAWNESH